MELEKLIENTQIETAPARYALRTAGDALQPQPPIDWIVEGLLSAGSISLVVGEAGSKKTWTALDLGVCVARGDPWLKFDTQTAPVLFIDEESGDRRLSRRLGQVLRGHQADETTPLFYTTLEAFDFGNPDDVNALHTMILEKGARLVIVDALADVMPGRDENAVKDVQPVFLALRKVADSTQSAIVIIHHSNKAGGYRGSTAIKGAVDLMLQVDSKADSPNIDLRTEKARDTEPLTFAAVAHFEGDQVYLTESKFTSSQALSSSQEYVIRFLATHGNSEKTTIEENADTCSEGAARQAIYSLASPKMAMITRVNSGDGVGGRGVKAVYGLTDKGRGYVRQFIQQNEKTV